MIRLRTGLILLTVVAMSVVGGAALTAAGSGYNVKLVMGSAAQLVKGSPVLLDGARVGSVDALSVLDGKAVVTISIDEEYAPLHDGTTTRVEWKSVLGERVVSIIPGSEENSPIPDGSLYEAKSMQIELDQVLAALDAPTRDKLKSLIGQLDSAVTGREQHLKATVRSAGPSVQALGEILHAVGRDGPSIRSLVTQLRRMMDVVAGRQQDVGGAVEDLTTFTEKVAPQQRALDAGLAELPSTLTEAQRTLGRVPRATDAASKLLKDLRPATRRLPGMAGNLRPVLQDLRPTVEDLKPTLVATNELLGRTPALLDTAHDVVPPSTKALTAYQPAVSFLRPWTPEAVGWLTNWGQAFAPYDSQGHIWSAFLSFGPTQFDDSTSMPPTAHKHDRPPKPGQAGGQPWHDAYGSGMR